MLMIVASHFSQHGISSFPVNSLTSNKLWQQFLFMGGAQGNDIFVMLSGYFLVKSAGLKYRKLFAIVSKVCFYAAVLFLLLFYTSGQTLSIKECLSSVKHNWWFIRTYIVMYLLHPYINVLLNNLSREDYRKFLASIWLYWCIIPTFALTNFQGNGLIDFICLYSLAGYFRLWADDFGSKKYTCFGFMFVMLNFLTVILLDIAGLSIPFLGKNALYFSEMMRPFTSMAALCFLLGFRKLNISQSRIINLAASASLGVYLLHENNFSKQFLWHNLFHVELHRDSQYLIIYSAAVVFSVYILCTVIELIRAKIFRTLTRGYLS